MGIAQQLADELDVAQKELAEAEIALLEANATAAGLRETVARLAAATAALNGESPPSAAPLPKQERKAPKTKSNNPLADVKCQGCGSIGTMVEDLVAAPSGATVRMLVCNKCNNQVL